MEYRRLGPSGLRVSEIALGAYHTYGECSVITGATHPVQIQVNTAAPGERLSPDVLNRIEEILH